MRYLFPPEHGRSQAVALACTLVCARGRWLPSLPMMASRVATAPPGAEAVDLRCLSLLSSRPCLLTWLQLLCGHRVTTNAPLLPCSSSPFPSSSFNINSNTTAPRARPRPLLPSPIAYSPLAKRQELFSHPPTQQHHHDHSPSQLRQRQNEACLRPRLHNVQHPYMPMLVS